MQRKRYVHKLGLAVFRGEQHMCTEGSLEELPRSWRESGVCFRSHQAWNPLAQLARFVWKPLSHFGTFTFVTVSLEIERPRIIPIFLHAILCKKKFHIYPSVCSQDREKTSTRRRLVKLEDFLPNGENVALWWSHGDELLNLWNIKWVHSGTSPGVNFNSFCRVWRNTEWIKWTLNNTGPLRNHLHCLQYISSIHNKLFFLHL